MKIKSFFNKMGTNNKKNIASEALLEMDSIKQSINEESKNFLKDMLQEAVKNALRESVNDDEDDENKEEYEVIDDTTDTDENGDASEVESTEETTSTEEEPKEDETETEESEDDAQEAPAEDGEGTEDDWSSFEQYQVGDDASYDLTGEDDINQVIKVFKLMKDDDNIVVKKKGDNLSITDNNSGDEYIVDLGTSDKDNVNESVDDYAGFDDNSEELEDETDDVETEDIEDIEAEKEPRFESKKSKKAMKESKERNIMLEIDLGYTDNYQDKDPIKGLSTSENNKNTKSWEKGVPTGTSKPWAGDSKSKGQPFEKSVNEEEELDECGAMEAQEPVVDEATNVGGAVQQRTNSKSHIPANRKEYGPKVKRHVSAGGDYNEVVENLTKQNQLLKKENAQYKDENKQLKESIKELRKDMYDTYVTNSNLAKIARLFTENVVTQDEKLNIVERFSNEAKTIEQSKALYESIDKELKKNNVKPITTPNSQPMSVENKTLNEDTYKSKDILTTIDLIKRVENC